MRLGILPPNVINKLKDQKVIWMHTVSVGEVQAVSTLVKDLKQQYPDYLLVISTVTKTGNKIVQSLIKPDNLAIYSPLDIGFIVNRVVNLVNPQLFIIAETEIWPNLITSLAKRAIPVVLVNGRISAASFKGYKLIRPFLKEVLKNFSLFCVQTKEDAQRITELGAAQAKVKVTGNMKFDISSLEFIVHNSELGLKENEQLFIAGSTHRGEEKIILEVCKELIESHPNLRLLIAPRHIERVQELEELISGMGFESQRVSNISRFTIHDSRFTNSVLILDTIGQLKDLYARADIVFIGGSLIPHGGQNPIEPAVFSKPILFGPYMSNFSNIAKLLLNKRAAMMVKDLQQLKDSCLELLNNPVLRKELGERAKELVQENRGASLRNMELIKQLLH
jgi:3-deoxy-D-manno-octulosonic-acid transferase